MKLFVGPEKSRLFTYIQPAYVHSFPLFTLVLALAELHRIKLQIRIDVIEVFITASQGNDGK
jgi:hypothetical protein